MEHLLNVMMFYGERVKIICDVMSTRAAGGLFESGPCRYDVRHKGACTYDVCTGMGEGVPQKQKQQGRLVREVA